MATIAVDFDGTIATGCSFPMAHNGCPNRFLIWWLKHRKNMGDSIILWTCRENYGGKWYPDGNYLADAISFCHSYGLEFNAVNGNVGEKWGECGHLYGRKITSDLYIDDKGFPVFKKMCMFLTCAVWLLIH